MNKFFIQLITLYQQFISPYKGFQCAHAYWHQGESCSAAVKHIIADQGLVNGYPAIRGRFKDCGHAYEEIKKDRKKRRDRRRRDDTSKCDYCDVLQCVPDMCVPRKGCMSGLPDALPCNGCSVDVLPCDCSL